MKHCEWCGGEFIPRNQRQRYCSDREHLATCMNCPAEKTFQGQPAWQRGKKRRDKSWACADCLGEVSKARRRATSQEKHGDPRYNNRAQARATMEERHGGGTTMESPILQNQVKATMKKKYGATTVKQGSAYIRNSASRRSRSQDIPLEVSLELTKLFALESALEEWLQRHLSDGERISYGELAMELMCSPTELSHVFSQRYPALKEKYIEVGKSYWEDLVVRELIFLGVNEEDMLLHRRPLEGREIDIWIPGMNLGFEINDFATHSRDKEDEPRSGSYGRGFKHGPSYHDWKVQAASSLGIALHHVWEDDIRQGNYRDELRHIIKENGRTP